MDITGFGHLLSFTDILINHHLVTTLVESWRSEIHTFHPLLGETTITLEDVALELGLPIDGEAITRVTSGELVFACQSLLSVAPLKNVVLGNTIKLSWLNNTFQQLPKDATNDVVAQYARAHILSLIGSMLMSDTSVNRVPLMYLLLLAGLNNASNFSWGSSVLASLYRALDHGVDYN